MLDYAFHPSACAYGMPCTHIVGGCILAFSNNTDQKAVFKEEIRKVCHGSFHFDLWRAAGCSVFKMRICCADSRYNQQGRG
jgi:hypothetical protein